MRTKMLSAALVLSVALCSRAFSQPAAPAPATAPAAAPAAASAEKPAPSPCKKGYFDDWHPMRPVKCMLDQLHTIGCAICGDRHCEATAKED
ncbi:MAG: hypothetical protein ABSG53_16050 [Thermoguttaceae bacterium]